MHNIPNTPVGQLIKSGRKAATARQLNLALASLCDLTLSYRHARWNVTGGNFTELQGLFGTFADEVDGLAERVAEWTVALNSPADATIQALFDRTNLDPLAHGVWRQGNLLGVLASRADSFAESLRAAADRTAVDQPTRDVYIDALGFIEGQRRRLLAHVQPAYRETVSVAA